jgi:GAF domain-containing protein
VSDSRPDKGKARQARNSAGGRADPGLAREFSELARNLQSHSDTSVLLQHIVAAGLLEVPTASSAGITVFRGGHGSTVASTDPVVALIDEGQYESGQGPCIDAAREHVTIRSDDLLTESRWPTFTAGALELGVRSVLAVQLFVEADSFGALNLYAAAANAFGPSDESVAILLASHAAIAVFASTTEHGLRVALDTRDLIGQAKGILMERFKLPAEQAFALLGAAAQARNCKLSEVAALLCQSGELASSPPKRRPARNTHNR